MSALFHPVKRAPDTTATTSITISVTAILTTNSETSSTSTSSTSTVGQSTSTSVTSSLPLVTGSATSATPLLSSTTSSVVPTTSGTLVSSSRTSLRVKSQPSPTSSSNSTLPDSQPNGSTRPNDRLSNGAVIGLVLGVALGLALLTFLATFVIMRRRKGSKRRSRSRMSEDRIDIGLTSPRHRGSTAAPAIYESYLPQSADDKTIEQKVRSTLDQIELHVENFYRNSYSPTLRPDNVELAKFDSPYLSSSLASLLPRSKNKLNIIKHALAHSITSSISPTSNSTQSFLPAEYTLLPDTVTSAKSSISSKPGVAQTLSRWRVMTAYLRPDPSKDVAYVGQLDKKISKTVQSFGRAFKPWQNTQYEDEERVRSLSAILEDAANLGIFLFSQPSTLKLHWPASDEVRSGRVVITPALLKTADEKGRELEEAFVMVGQVIRDA